MKKVDRRRLDTKRLYHFEGEYFRGSALCGIRRLRCLARRIWREAGRKGPVPEVVAGRGDYYNGRFYSYYLDRKIVLCRNERRAFVLLHELVHAMGYDDHDRRFVRRYFQLLRRYRIGRKEVPVEVAARQYGLRW